MVVLAGIKILDFQKADTIVVFDFLWLTLFKEQTDFPGSSFPPEMHFILFELCNFLAGHKFLAGHLEVEFIRVIRFGITSIFHA